METSEKILGRVVLDNEFESAVKALGRVKVEDIGFIVSAIVWQAYQSNPGQDTTRLHATKAILEKIDWS